MQNITITGQITEISDIIPLKKIKNGQILHKRIVHVSFMSEDGLNNNTIAIEVVNKKLKLIEKLDLKVDDVATFTVSLRCITVNNSIFNNVYCQNITM